jgi:crotonobetaine/carnitine-CoA ligase
MPEKTLEAFRNLYFHTGDLGKKDSDGYFYFVDRKKDYIRKRGENISSYEVETVVNSHPTVLNCAAIRVKSEVEEDEIKVVVELKPGKTLEPKELLDFCQERMAYYMVPRYVEYKKLPLTPTGRIEKYKLRSEGLTSSTWDRESVGYEVKR